MDFDGEKGWLCGNYVYIGDFDVYMDYIVMIGFYLLMWDEFSVFIDGWFLFFVCSVIIIDDDVD